MGDAVGIGKDEVIALSRGESAVKDDIFPETLVLVPKVSGGARQGKEKSLDQVSGPEPSSAMRISPGGVV
jgi:hypothetical protein